ncbi:hypothetical protein N473_04570 [Pseudoalteromonas luteoviolacea CPMOR-1]|uniref:Uncharacterized protein n=1 Tax=Pseudoalteromonas luteoviolacea CPMOR-1 TaxID=1365248 RepID=A0A167HZM6_9GAMM|nr:hypothetical protein [Pseudoalteromonas luteoviolacea]KZN58713.1 hypothetical protein N473_04570 [Pseudoalteromonas luteoviolacea CPMOR-1]
MFAYENFTVLYDAIMYMLVPIYIISLIIAWKSINARYLISVILIVEVFDALTYGFAFSLKNNYYLWAIFVSLLFIVPVLGRRLIALSLSSRFKFFEKVHSDYNFTRQEGGLIFLYALAIVVCFMTFIEVSLYASGVITVHPIRDNFFSPVLSVIHTLEAFLVLSIAVKNNERLLINRAGETTRFSALNKNT